LIQQLLKISITKEAKMGEEKQMNRREKRLQELYGYTDEEMAIYLSNPKHKKAFEQAPKFATHRIIIEVAEAHNCIAGHKPGERIAVMTGNALLITHEMPEHVCAFGLAAAVPRVYAMWERFYEDLDPNGIFLDTIHCPDVGCSRGGAGEIIMKIYAEEKPPRKK
jgi:uncharacterized repeat protein (TIGR04076 family)